MSFLKTLLLFSLSSCALLAQEDTQDDTTPLIDLELESPNVILIIADDLGLGDFSAQGNKWISTPALDKLANNSLRFQTCYVNPVGPLSRASIFTGRYSIRTKCIDTSLGRSMMASDEVTIAEALSGAGYKTAIFGKWNLGDNYPMRPIDQGFDTSLVMRGNGIGTHSEPIENNNSTTDPILFHNAKEVQRKGFTTDIFFKEAIDFIELSNNNQQPFFATIAPGSPDREFPVDTLKNHPPAELSQWGAETNELTKVAASLSNLDSNIGKLFQTLEEQKLLDDTIIIFISDNGPAVERFNKQHRGTRGDITEGAIRSPLWIHWPKKITKSATLNSPIAAHIDIMPTILDLCDLGVPDAFEFDGISLASTVEPREDQPKPRAIISQWHNGATPVRRHHFMIRKGDWKLLNPSDASSPRRDSENYELYNITQDPSENNNLAGQNKKKVEELLKEYDAWFADVNETRIRDKGTPYILIDRNYENPVVLTWQDRISKAATYQSPGFWKLQFEHAGRCDIRIEFPHSFKRDLSEWTATLTLGKQTYTKVIPHNEPHYIFPAINFTKGKHPLSITFTSPDKKETLSGYQVRLSHR